VRGKPSDISIAPSPAMWERMVAYRTIPVPGPGLPGAETWRSYVSRDIGGSTSGSDGNDMSSCRANLDDHRPLVAA